MVIKKRRSSRPDSWIKRLEENKYKIALAIVFLAIASFIDYLAGSYTTSIQGAYVKDIILDHTKPINLGFIFVWGWLTIVFVFFAYPVFFKPEKIHLAVTMFGLLILVRSISITLTHLGTPPDAIPVDFPSVLALLRFKNDLFFSGHTALPFLGFLLFKKRTIKYFMLASSFIMAATVLLMHQHYSIDVFAAFFISYGVYKIGDKIFKSDIVE